MSQYYDLGDETLWNPSNGASRLFLHQVAVFEAELGLPSGIGPMEMDESQVDPAALGVFANALLDRYQQSLHAVVRALTEGFLLTVLALAERAGVGIRWEPSAPAPGAGLRDVQVPVGASAPDGVAELRRKVRELSRFMAR
ncbi:hypothetical protein Kpho02_37730 [Kitasatospora phosalacinea]|uniref:Uncharacterized protein n=1 Tax=Kitasatospora phosalacinea TaxID=2065 RepID=A0A9W6Q832_9ACTN|nr:DUF6086 family protein [Kitasatospora phosalacinea]GLW71474.1 hypothetical protein Kpho02_37730 [Kitasatospora phosalacinea]